MNIFGQEIYKDMMPSYVDPKNAPYHQYSSMQDILNAKLNSNPMAMAQMNTNTATSNKGMESGVSW